MALLQSSDFEEVIEGGFDRPSNSIAHSMTEFEGALYVGATAPKATDPDSIPSILRYDPAAGSWERVYEPDSVDVGVRAYAQDVQTTRGDSRKASRGRRGQTTVLPRDFGYRSMIVFQGRSDPKPCLYATSMSYLGGRVLRSEDGRCFENTCEPGLGNSSILSLRGLTELGDRLFAAPVGTINEEKLDRNMAPEPAIYVSDDPASGRWDLACEIGFGDPNNESIFSVGRCGPYVYAGTSNPKRGFQLWRTRAEGDPPFAWERVLTDGAYRWGMNFAVATLIEFKGALYIGCGITGFGYDKPNDIGPVAAEMLRLNPDDSWDLLFGEARFTPDGLKFPLSMEGPGAGDPFNSVVWSMEVHDGALYAGMHNWEPFKCVLEKGASELTGGYQLWVTENGNGWSVALDAEGRNRCSYGIRTLRSTDHGLYVGTLNHTKLVQLMGKMNGFSGDLSQYSRGFEILRGR